MPYSYFIGQGNYNKFYKNLWNDFFVYQYKQAPHKERSSSQENLYVSMLGSDYRIAGTDDPIPATNWYKHFERVRDILSFNYPEENLISICSPREHDITIESAVSKDTSKHLVAFDSRKFRSNPFYTTYRCCKPGNFVRFVRSAYILKSNNSLTTNALHTELYNSSSTDVDIKEYTPTLNALRSHLRYWEQLGLVRHAGNKNCFQWLLSELRLQDILQMVDESALHSALLFFSNTLPFGSIGINLLRRLGHNETSVFNDWLKGSAVTSTGSTMTFGSKNYKSIGETKDIFRFKHTFVSQALNDYNAIDLLHAINNGKWCHIEFRHPTRLNAESMIAYPLQIKTSADDGREYIFCFEPTTHMLSHLRLDYIESVHPITSISFDDSNDVLLTTYKEHLLGEKKRSKSNYSGKELTEIYRDEIENAKEWGKHSWGVSAFSKGVKIGKPETKRISVKFSYDPNNEPYILKRIERERRIGEIAEIDEENGVITFEVEVIDVVELCKWLQSFFCRININDITLTDVQNRIQKNFELACMVYSENALLTNQPNNNPDTMSIPEGVSFEYSDTYHEHLFNEFMSDCSEYIIYSASSGTKNTSGAYTQYYSEAKDSIKTLSKFCLTSNITISHSDFYRSTLPLLTIEKRWLLSMLNSPLINLFFDGNTTDADGNTTNADVNTIDALKKLLSADGSAPLFTKETYQTFGQHQDIADLCTDSEFKQEYIGRFRALTKFIRTGKFVTVDYQKNISDTFAPLWLEYSMRENRFRFFGYRYSDGKIYSLNLERFNSLPKMHPSLPNHSAGQPIKRADFDPIVAKYYIDHQTHVTVRFTDYRNTPDRILNEFSGYRKYCVKDPGSGIYTMVIFFDKSDYKDIATRLMSYAASALVAPDDDSGVYNDIKVRLEEQKALNDKALIAVPSKEKE